MGEAAVPGAAGAGSSATRTRQIATTSASSTPAPLTSLFTTTPVENRLLGRQRVRVRGGAVRQGTAHGTAERAPAPVSYVFEGDVNGRQHDEADDRGEQQAA